MYDKDFLLKLDKSKHKTIFAKITALNYLEHPIESIEGRVTQGSINLDGASTVRRSCSLTLIAQDFKYNEFYWGMNTKFKLEIGVLNTVDSSYPEIIWFPQGIYLISTFNTSRNTNNFTISIQGKDKMCQLNGEVGGTLGATIDFGVIEEEQPNGTWVSTKIPIPEIIRNLVHVYGGEPYHNIIINDLSTVGLELLEYRYDIPLYLYRSAEPESAIYQNMTIDGTIMCTPQGETRQKPLSELTVANDELDPLMDHLITNQNLKYVTIDGRKWYIAKIEYGDTAGYRETELTYAGDLIANPGDSITSVLDKIKNMLVEFEYFYDLDGRFVFQKKQSFISTMWSDSASNYMDKIVQESLAIASNHTYTFNGSELITAFNNSPQLLNLRNDYSVWGERETISGQKVPIHMRYAIDVKPVSYTQILVPEDDPEVIAYNKKHQTSIDFQPNPVTFTIDDCDWRELIYQMAVDHYKYNFLNDFELRVAAANPDPKIGYSSGRTGYEQYYIDMYSFWRELYNPNLNEDLIKAQSSCGNLEIDITNKTDTLFGIPNQNTGEPEGGLKEYLANIINSETNEEARRFIEQMYTKFPDYIYKDDKGINIYEPNMVASYLRDTCNQLERTILALEEQLTQAENTVTSIQYNKDEVFNDTEHPGWNSAVFSQPDTLNFWFDFLGTYVNETVEGGDSALGKFNTKNIGIRTKAINDTNVKSIYFRETPNIIFSSSVLEYGTLPGYRYIQVPDIENMFKISAQGKSAKEKMDELLYQHSYCIESATITSIPIYYLEPNTRIYLHDPDTGLDGDYILSKLTIPLAYNGTMSITATKAAENII